MRNASVPLGFCFNMRSKFVCMYFIRSLVDILPNVSSSLSFAATVAITLKDIHLPRSSWRACNAFCLARASLSAVSWCTRMRPALRMALSRRFAIFSALIFSRLSVASLCLAMRSTFFEAMCSKRRFGFKASAERLCNIKGTWDGSSSLKSLRSNGGGSISIFRTYFQRSMRSARSKPSSPASSPTRFDLCFELVLAFPASPPKACILALSALVSGLKVSCRFRIPTTRSASESSCRVISCASASSAEKPFDAARMRERL
mmetsp:Transcript_129777/g.276957  ORF Transcript_129777/g.276957 Transcript_129777/m.276957 type:complete len:260 (-) Transcript_129777:541-1320(-)